MSEEKTIRQLREGYQPSKDIAYRGYPVNQDVDPNKLKIPSDLGSAAVTPEPSNQLAPTTNEPKK